MSFYGSFGSQQQNDSTQDPLDSMSNIDLNSFEDRMYDYIAPYPDDGDDTLSLFDFEDESLFEAEDLESQSLSQLLYECDDLSIKFESESQLNMSPSPQSDCASDNVLYTSKSSGNSAVQNESSIVIPSIALANISAQLVERQHHYHLFNSSNYNNYGARRFFMPLPPCRFSLMHHYEIEQVLRKQLSHMMLPDPLSADFYCGVTQAREGKIWEGFGVPGPGHVYIDKCSKYPKHNDGSPILPPGTLGKTAGFVSVHAPKSVISINNDDDDVIAANNDDIDIDISFSRFNIFSVIDSVDIGYNARDIETVVNRCLSRDIEIGYDHLMLFEGCNASIFYVFCECSHRIKSCDDISIFSLCLSSRDRRLKNLIIWCNLTSKHHKFYRIFMMDKGRKLIYRIFVLFEADDGVLMAMLSLLTAKIYIFATCFNAHRISSKDIEFGDKLRNVLFNKMKKISTHNALIIFKLILINLESFGDVTDRIILCKSRLICNLLSVIIKVSRSKDDEWIQSFNQFCALFDNDLSFLIPKKCKIQTEKIYGKDIVQWNVLNASPRILWELICDIFIGFDDANSIKLCSIPKFWHFVKENMWYYPSARFIAMKHSILRNELNKTINKDGDNTEKKCDSNNPYYPTASTQSMHYYVNTMREWLNAFKRNQAKQIEKERQHQINIAKQTKRQREYDKMLQQKRDLQNERFKQQFFKALKEKQKRDIINQSSDDDQDIIYKTYYNKIKKDKEKEEEKKIEIKKAKEKDDETLMMIKHGMQHVNIKPQREYISPKYAYDNDYYYHNNYYSNYDDYYNYKKTKREYNNHNRYKKRDRRYINNEERYNKYLRSIKNNHYHHQNNHNHNHNHHNHNHNHHNHHHRDKIKKRIKNKEIKDRDNRYRNRDRNRDYQYKQYTNQKASHSYSSYCRKSRR